MTNYFALLGETRGAWIDETRLKEKFHERARSEHPDVRGGSSDFTELNAAYRTLSDPKLRLVHLLALSGCAVAAISEPPPDLVEMFFETANALNAAKRGSLAEVNAQLARVIDSRNATIDSLRNIELSDLNALQNAHRCLAFLDRWQEQLVEATLH